MSVALRPPHWPLQSPLPKRRGSGKPKPAAHIESLLRCSDRCHQFLDGGIGIDFAIELAGDHVIEGILDGGRGRVAMRERAHEGALLTRFGQIPYGLLAAIIEGRIGYIGTPRDRA